MTTPTPAPAPAPRPRAVDHGDHDLTVAVWTEVLTALDDLTRESEVDAVPLASREYLYRDGIAHAADTIRAALAGPRTPAGTVRAVVCVEVTCTGCDTDVWGAYYDGAPHFDSIAAARDLTDDDPARPWRWTRVPGGWAVTCPTCLAAEVCATTGHVWGPWIACRCAGSNPAHPAGACPRWRTCDRCQAGDQEPTHSPAPRPVHRVCAEQGHDWRGPFPGGAWRECARCLTVVPAVTVTFPGVTTTTTGTPSGQENPR